MQHTYLEHLIMRTYTLPPGAHFVHNLTRPLPARLASRQYTGPYVVTPGDATAPVFFYLASDFAPGMRWAWVNDVVKMRHTGWYTTEAGWSDGVIRGVVFTLPHGRGFLAGWSMGEGMASEMDRHIYGDAESAAYAADSMAERAAERCRDDEARDLAEQEAEEARHAELSEGFLLTMQM